MRPWQPCCPARGAVEMAALDLLGHRLDVPAVQLLGGPCRTALPVAWTLSTGSTGGDIEEGECALAERGHRRFKLKFGRQTAAADVARAAAILEAFRGRATVIADVNQTWDAVIAARHLPGLQDAGLEAIEQPLPAGGLAGIARLRAGLGMEIIADEAVAGPAAAFRIAAGNGASAFALKPNRDGGPTATRRVAAIAAAAGLGLYGGTMLETSVGTAACAPLCRRAGLAPGLRAVRPDALVRRLGCRASARAGWRARRSRRAGAGRGAGRGQDRPPGASVRQGSLRFGTCRLTPFTYTALPTRIVFGMGTIHELPAELARLGCRRACRVHAGAAGPGGPHRVAAGAVLHWHLHGRCDAYAGRGYGRSTPACAGAFGTLSSQLAAARPSGLARPSRSGRP